jgi:hypothetical protein
MINLLLPLIMACGDGQPEPLFLTREFYDWTCRDYQDRSEIVVTTNTCEDHETGLLYIIAEYQLHDRPGYKRHLTKAANWQLDCVWQTEFPLLDDICIEVEGVSLTAYIEPATWSGMFFGD